jgi:hypothetical protein
MMRARGFRTQCLSGPDNREQHGTITKPLFNGAISSPRLVTLGTAATPYPSRRYHAAVQRTTCATPYVPPPCRGGRASSDFFGNNGAPTAEINLCANRSAYRPGRISARRDEGSNPVSPRMNSNLVETRNWHPHLQSITTLAFAFRGHAGA